MTGCVDPAMACTYGLATPGVVVLSILAVVAVIYLVRGDAE